MEQNTLKNHKLALQGRIGGRGDGGGEGPSPINFCRFTGHSSEFKGFYRRFDDLDI